MGDIYTTVTNLLQQIRKAVYFSKGVEAAKVAKQELETLIDELVSVQCELEICLTDISRILKERED